MSNYKEGYFNLKNNTITELPSHLFRTYSYMISRDFKGEGIWMSQQTIANELNVSVRTVQRHIKALKERNYINSRRRGFNMSNIYTMVKGIVSKVKEKKEELTTNFKKSFATSKKKSPKLKFDNFAGRNYSDQYMDDLEKKLLGWE